MKGWVTKRLGDLIELLSGQHIEAKDYNTEQRGVGYLTGPSDFGPVYPVVSKWTEFPKVKARKGDILITVKGSGVGKINLLDEDEVAISRQLMAIRVTKADRQFVYLFLSSVFDHFQEASTGAAIPGISREQVLGLPIAVPPLAEQQRIVGVLDEAFEGLATARANAEKNLQNARALFESHLQAVFTQRGPGWVEKRIEEWCDSIMDCVNKTAPVVEGPTPFKMIRTTNVRHGRVDVSSVRYVTEETYQVWTRRQTPQKGDVILTREAPMGEVGMLLTDDKVFLGQRLVSYRANSAKLDNHFLLFALQSGDLQGQIHAKASGSTVQHMRVPDTKNLLLAAPPLAKQREVVAQLASLRAETQRLTSLYERKLAALAALKKALLHQAFAGAL